MSQPSEEREERPRHRSRPLLALAQWGSAAAGAAIAWRGLRRRDGLGALATLGGAALAASGAASALAGPERLLRSGRSLVGLTAGRAAELRAAVTINRPRAELYALWRDLSLLALWMPQVLEVRPEGEGRWRWAVRGPGGITAEWEAELVEARADERLAWRSVEGAEVAHEGAVEFRPAPGGRGSEVHVGLSFAAPAGRAGRALAGLFGAAPGAALRDGLRRLKQQIETGEVAAPEPRPAGGG